MATTVELADFRPPIRHDENAWTGATVQEADDPAGAWSKLSTAKFTTLDEDPSRPRLRSVTAATSKAWLRLLFTRESEESVPCPFIAVGADPFTPTLAEVSVILRARTYVDGSNLEGEPEGGQEAGVFNKDTRPTGEQVETLIIPQACSDVRLALGNLPGELVGDGRRVASLRAAVDIERSYIPEQEEGTGGTIFQTLRLSAQDAQETLARSLQMWVLSRDLEAQAA